MSLVYDINLLKKEYIILIIVRLHNYLLIIREVENMVHFLAQR